MNNLAIGKLIAAMLTISVLLTGCGTLNPANGTTQSDSGTGAMQTVPEDIQDEGMAVSGLNDLATYDYTTQEIEVLNNGQTIYGVAYVPALEDASPLIICSHGLGGSYRSCAAYAEQLAMHGIAAYCFDFRGGGGSMSDGDTTEMS